MWAYGSVDRLHHPLWWFTSGPFARSPFRRPARQGFLPARLLLLLALPCLCIMSVSGFWCAVSGFLLCCGTFGCPHCLSVPSPTPPPPLSSPCQLDHNGNVTRQKVAMRPRDPDALLCTTTPAFPRPRGRAAMAPSLSTLM